MMSLVPITSILMTMGIINRKCLNFGILYVLNLTVLLMGTSAQYISDNFSSAASANCIKLMTWNASGIMSSGSYLGSVLKRLNIDICGVSEHWLYKKDLHFLDSVNKSYYYSAVSDFDLERPSRRKVGKGGVAILWNRSIDHRVSLLNIDDDRIIGIQYQLSESNFIYIIQVYLPSANHCMAEFEGYLSKVQDLCSMYSEKGTLLIMGDFNAHRNGQSFVKCHDRRSTLLHQLLSNNNFLSVNTLPICTGASSTFVSYSGEYTSMIDHILIPAEKVDLVSVCKILDDAALNVSTHRPILMHINFPYVEQIDFNISFRRSVKWRGIKQDDIIQYRESLENLCSNKTTNNSNTYMNQDIDVLYTDIVNMITSASDKHLPQSKVFKKHLKPYWDQTLKDLHRVMRDKRKVWILDNRPRGIPFTSYMEYKDAKRIFRQYHRKCADNYLKSLNEEIDSAAGLDSQYFWKLVNTRRNSSSANIGAEIRFDNKICRDPQEICGQWGRFFSCLYTAVECESFDALHYNNVTARVDELKGQTITESDVVLVTEQELDDAVRQLSRGKACGEDRIDNEHIIYSGCTFRKTFVTLFNAMLLKSYIPESMKIGILVTLYKGGNKRKDDPNSYRAITLTSSVLKLFERILLKRILTIQRPFNPLQGGFQKSMGCNMTSWLLQESVYYARENGSKLYICFLDAKKAFDKVWHDGLFLKLYEMGMEFYIWKVIVSLHANMSSYVLFRGFKSSVFSVTQGTRQGGVLSTYLFPCFIDDLLNQLCASDKGFSICGINVCCPTVVDDMLLQSLTKLGLQALIDISAIYFHLWRLEYNVLKCAVLVCNESNTEFKRSNRRWTLGDDELMETDKYTHLGIVCNKNMDMKVNIMESSSKIRRIFFGLISSSFCEQDLHPLTLKRIYETVVLPKALYGCELWASMSQTDTLLLERSHRLCLKTIQDIDRKTRTCVALSMIGSSDLKYEIQKRKATLLGQLCRLDPHYTVKRLFLHRVTSYYFFKDLKYGFVLDIFRFLEDYNMEYILTEYLNSGVFPSKYKWKQLVREKLKDKAILSTRLEIIDEGLERFLSIHQEVKPSLFWELCRKYPYMLAACRSVIKLIAILFKRYQPVSICLACGELFVKYVDHCLFWCHANSGARHKMWVGFWHKFGVNVYLRLVSLKHDTLIDVLFGHFDIIAGVLSVTLKDDFYCFVARSIHIQKTVRDSMS